MERQASRVGRSILAQSPTPYLILSPALKIMDANAPFLAATHSLRDALLGVGVFEAFPDNPFDEHANGVRNLGASFERVLAVPGRDDMPVQRYDVRDRRGVWEVRWWKPSNWSVRDDDGAVIAIVQHVLDVTEPVLAQSLAQSSRALPLDLLSRAEVALELARREHEEATWRLAEAVAGTRTLLGRRASGPEFRAGPDPKPDEG